MTSTHMYSRGTRAAILDALNASNVALTIFARHLQGAHMPTEADKCEVITRSIEYALERINLDDNVLIGLPTLPGGAA